MATSSQPVQGVSDIVAINDHQFLLIERDGKGLGDGSTAAIKQIFKIDITGATDITNLTGAAAAGAAVSKTLVLDLVAALTAAGIPTSQIPAKIEGLAFGDDIVLNGVIEHTFYISNDNDFLPNTAGGNKIYVFGFSNADLPDYAAQQIAETPLPPSLVLFGTGLLGLAGARWRSRRQHATVRQA